LLLLAGFYGRNIVLNGYRYLRSALTSIGTLATDVTRRLDYTYYNLLEKITALNSTISSFQELSDSASTLLNDFERETAGLDQDIRKQINDLQGFTPQIEKADALEQRMKAGRQRVEELGKRLETVRHEIDSWEQREKEWQMRTTRRLRIWGIVLGALVILAVALVSQSQQNGNRDRNVFRHPQLERLTAFVDHDSVLPWDFGVRSKSAAGPTLPSSLADRRESLENAGPGPTSTGSGYDPLRVLDEL
jgi:tetrahydromethanopterin S-methyltransferase subunit B